MARHPPARIGVIGYGAITDEIVRCLEICGELDRLIGVLDIPEKLPELAERASGRFPVFTALSDLLARTPAIVIEAAGHGAVHAFGADILKGGCALLIASTGALADDKLSAKLIASMREGTELWIASGAVAGIDGLLAARTAGLQSVTYTSLKGPAAWRGTAAHALLGDDAKGAPRDLFLRQRARSGGALPPERQCRGDHRACGYRP
jgi:aspartate dehydrogenase